MKRFVPYSLLCTVSGALAPACLGSETTRCGDVLCPPNRVCDIEEGKCILPAQQEACAGKVNGEACEIPGQTGLFVCRNEVCRRSTCGDGVLDRRPEMGEVCDDGNTVNGDGCRADCAGLEACGDGILDQVAGEACDEGAGNSDTVKDACRTDCRPARCGDGITDSGEECDDATRNSDHTPNACRSGCALPTCGDGVLDGLEEALCWQEMASLSTGTNPISLAVGDLNGDDLPDAVVGSEEPNVLSVFLSDASGQLTEHGASPFSALGRPRALVVIDVNHDGHQDVVVGHDNEEGISVHLGEGDSAGSLIPPTHYNVVEDYPDGPERMVLAYFNGDEHLDGAAITTDQCYVWIGLGDGAGDFDFQRRHHLPGDSCYDPQLVAADLDDDGKVDLLGVSNPANLYVLAGDGNGGFAVTPESPRVLEGHGSVRDVALADVDEDGFLDVVYISHMLTASWLGVLINQGDLAFAHAVGSPLSLDVSMTERLTTTDLNQDEHLDLVITKRFGENMLLVLTGGGDGSFSLLPPFYLDTVAPVDLVARDLNGDSRPDLVLTERDQNALYVFFHAP